MVQFLRPTSTVGAGSWVALGAATLHEATDEGVDAADEDATYAETDTDGFDMELALGAGTKPQSTVGHRVQWRARRHGAAIQDATVQVQLYEGATLRASGTATHGESAYANGSFLLTSAEVASLVDYTNLRLRARLSAFLGGAFVHLTALELVVLDSGFDPDSRLHPHTERGRLVLPLTEEYRSAQLGTTRSGRLVERAEEARMDG